MTAAAVSHMPLAALRHDEPTAVGQIELSGPLTVCLVDPGAADGYRDQLLLVRLAGEPIGIVHVDRPPGRETADDLAAAIWAQAGDRLRLRLGTADAPAGPEALVGGILGGRAAPAVERPPGRAVVVVATVGRVDRLERALVSLVAMDDPDFEVLVVDNRPAEPATRALVERLAVGGRIRYTQEPRPGLAIARNAGIAATGGAQFLAFTDDDVVADPGWLRWLLTPFADPNVQGTTGMVLPLELASPSQKRFELYSGFGKGVDPTLYDLTEHRADDRLLYPYWGGMFGSGNSMAFRRRTLLEIGGFDPALGAGTPTGGGEDTAAFTDVILRGGRLAYEPRSICWHEHRRDEEALRAQVYNYGVGFTAALWRYATRDPRFYVAVARTVPVAARLARTRKAQRETDRLPADLTRLEMRGRLVGPHRYVKSRRAASRMKDESPSGA